MIGSRNCGQSWGKKPLGSLRGQVKPDFISQVLLLFAAPIRCSDDDGNNDNDDDDDEDEDDDNRVTRLGFKSQSFD